MAAYEGTILVTPEELSNAASVLSTKLSDLSACFENIEEIMNASSSYWVGEAGEAHRMIYTEQKSSIEDILALYQEHVTDLREMAGVYTEAEQSAEEQAEELPPVEL